MSPSAATTVAELLAARAHDDGIGLIAGDERWTWRQVVEQSETVARWLTQRRRPGPFHVGVLLDNTPDYLFTLFGAALAGAAVVGINPTRRGAELARDIGHTDCQLVVTDGRYAELLDGLDLGDAPIVRVDDDGWPPEPNPAPPAAGDPADHDGADHDGAQGPAGPPTAGDLFVLIFTSGSTGAPKAVRMTHGRAAAMAAGSTWLGPEDVLYSAMPLFHGNALNAIVFPALATGATIVLRARFSASRFMPDVRRYGVTFFSTVGRALAYILATPETPQDRDNQVKFALAPESSPADMKAFRRRFGISCFAGYGSSENALIFTPVSGMPADALGVPLEGTDAAVVDPDTLAELPPAAFDEDGRLLNAGAAIGELVGRNVVARFEGYYNNAEAEAERTRNGWYWSGDLGYRDGDGIFYFAGRSGDWIRVDAENFASAPVERILGRFPGAVGVAVYAVPDERTADDQVMAALELEPGASFDPDAFAAFLADQADLGTKWAPRYVRLTTLPVGATNKIDGRSLKADRWYTDDPIYWRPEPRSAYRRFGPADLEALERRFAEHGRAVDRR